MQNNIICGTFTTKTNDNQHDIVAPLHPSTSAVNATKRHHMYIH